MYTKLYTGQGCALGVSLGIGRAVHCRSCVGHSLCLLQVILSLNTPWPLFGVPAIRFLAEVPLSLNSRKLQPFPALYRAHREG